MDAANAVSVAVVRTVRAGREADYEAWLRRAIAAAQTFPGHLGADVLRPPPGGRQYLLLFRYGAMEQLLAWEQSDVRRALIAEVDALTEGPAQLTRASGMETWFTLPGGHALVPPPRWKMALVTWIVAFPLIQALTLTLGKVLAPLPALARGALVGAAMVLTMTYLLMPLVTRALAKWLYPKPSA
jgi:antibiotic biosynthesis monooxygenase (ABM) superfamily enzyme